MTHVSKKYLSRELENNAWERFWAAAKTSLSARDFKANLGKFLTPSEIVMLEKRLAIPLLLGQNLSYRKIGETLDVSSTTISFVKHNLTRKPRVHRRYSSPEARQSEDDASLFMSPREHMKRMYKRLGF
jgi:Trp operon repressor